MNAQHNIAARTKRVRLTLGAAVAVWLAAAPLALAQPAAPPGAFDEAAPDVQISVRAATERGEMITVPVNQGAIVDFSVPVREVRVANPEIADVNVLGPRQILVNGKAFGTTQLIVTVNGGAQVTYTVAVDLDLERLAATIAQRVPRAKVDVSALMDSVVIAGTVPDEESAERIMQIANIYSTQVINHMRVAGVQQVLLRCTVAEVNRNATRQLGFNGWIAGDDFPNAFGVSQIGGINPINIGAAADAPATGTIPFLTGTDGIPLTGTPQLSFGFPRVQMQIFIQALRQNNLMQVLAEPNLVTLSGQEASFLAGGELPIPIAQEEGISIEYRDYGVKLNFTPTVLGNDLIRLHVMPEVSEPDYTNAVTIGGFSVPGLVQRRAETVVELGPGQTFAIGGLLSERTRGVVSKVPGIGDLPVLGALFRSVDYQTEESELVILVTPELVSPLNPYQIVGIPAADHIPPNDWELFALGQLDGEGDPTQPTPAAKRQPEWPVQQEELYGQSAALRLRGPVGPAGAREEG
jgi:pilus assembly protein CpaC